MDIETIENFVVMLWITGAFLVLFAGPEAIFWKACLYLGGAM